MSERELWDLGNRLRGEYGGTPGWSQIVTAARRDGVKVGWREATDLVSRDRTGLFFVPNSATDLVCEFLGDREPQTVVSLNEGMATTAIAVAENCQSDSVRCVVQTPEVLDAIRLLQGADNVSWLDGTGANVDELVAEADIVLSAPVAKSSHPIRSDHEHLARVIPHLSSSSEAVFMTPGHIFEVQPVAQHLPEWVGPYAVVTVPRNRGFNIPAEVLFVRRTPSDTVFAGELSPGIDITALVANLRSGHEGKLPELGRIVPSNVFESWRKIVLDEEIAAESRSMGCEAVALGDIAQDVRWVRAPDDDDGYSTEHTVYIPALPHHDAGTRLDDVLAAMPRPPTRPLTQRVVAVELSPEAARPDYVAAFLNGRLGRKVRERAGSGAAGSLQIRRLPPLPIFLPDPAVQTAVSGLQREIRGLAAQLDDLDRDLLQRPLLYKEVDRRLGELAEHDPLEAWIERLPFPLASIL